MLNASLPGPKGSGSLIRARSTFKPQVGRLMQLEKDIDRPLGLATGTAARPRSLKPTARSAIGALCVLSILAVSSAIALRERPFRKPAISVTTTPLVS
ncbi:MAG: hypothetical protein M3Y43_09310, partial [Pseudomonadota bacterium]|nr:hypothetical protein [Pseudomonadota bacterium]